MISFALPRFCDQSLVRSRKERALSGRRAWIAKLDTIVHELYHIDPDASRDPPHANGPTAPTRPNCHGPTFFEQVVEMVKQYLATRPDPAVLRFPARQISSALERRYGGVVGTTFRTFPSYPQRYIEVVDDAAASSSRGVRVEPLPPGRVADALHRGRSARPRVQPRASRRLQRSVAA